jgi:membrane-associated phospholipid phosphatase
MSWRKLLPRGPGDLVWQILLFCGAYWAYRLVRGEVFDQSAAAFEHARQIVDAEKALHLFFEPSLQNWAIQSRWIDDVGSWMYLNTHFVVTTLTLAFIYLFRNEHFYWVRNMFMVAMGLALVGYVLYPTAPPRMLPELGFVDSVSDFTGVSSDASVNALFNPYAAVPSMHVGFALMVGWPLARLARRRVARLGWALYPLLVTWVVLVTGNHYLLDVALGALTAGVAVLAARRLPVRVRVPARPAEVPA